MTNLPAVAAAALIGFAGNELVATYRDPAITAVQAHQITVAAEHNLLHAIPRLSAALVHADPQPHGGADFHQALASHRRTVAPPQRTAR